MFMIHLAALAVATTISLAPLVDQWILPVLGSVLTGLAAWAVAHVGFLARLTAQASQRALVLQVIDNGISWAEGVLAKQPISFAATGKTGLAVQYVTSMVPAALTSLGVTPAKLTQIVDAKIQQAAPTPPPAA